MMKSALIAVPCLLAASCAAPAPAQVRRAGDWTRTPQVTLRLDVGYFHPGRITLRAGDPVRLVFENGGGATDDFVTSFFSTVSQRAGPRQGGVRVILQPAERVEYDIVPRVHGTYIISTVMNSAPGDVPPAEIVVH